MTNLMTTLADTTAAPANGLANPGNKAAATVAAASPSRPGNATPATEIPLTAGLEQLDPSKIAEAFMGSPVEVNKDEEQKEETTTTTEETEEGTEETEGTQETEETQDGEETEETEGTETGEEPSDLEKGLEKALGNDPKLKGLHKRIKKIFAQNKEFKAEVETLKAEKEAAESQPVTVLAATSEDLLASVMDAAGLKQAEENAEWWIDWCEENRDGGTLGEGTEQESVLSKEQVNRQLKLARKVQKQVPARAKYLATYQATAKELGSAAKELVKGETREAGLLAKVPEIMRDPEYLRFLADAKAGRELREKQAKGVKLVEVDPNKGKAAAEPGTKPKPKPAPKVEEAETLTEAGLAELRTKADAGDKTAQARLERFFMS